VNPERTGISSTRDRLRSTGMTSDWTTLEVLRVRQVTLDVAIIIGALFVLSMPAVELHTRDLLSRALFISWMAASIVVPACLWTYSVFGSQGSITRDGDTLTFTGRLRFSRSVRITGATAEVRPWFEAGGAEIGGQFFQGPLLKISNGRRSVLVSTRDPALGDQLLTDREGRRLDPTYEVAPEDFVRLLHLFESSLRTR
jgi:hypothetical protein